MSDAAIPVKEEAVAAARIDWIPIALTVGIALAALPLVGSFPTWVTLTVAGLAMGMMIFVMASGLTLVFGLMDVINFGHGVFISVGAYVSLLILWPLASWVSAPSVVLNVTVLLLCILVAMAATGLFGWAFERVIVRPVYGQHLKQILVTMGGLIVVEQLIHVFWGASPITIALPETFRGAFAFGPDVVVERGDLLYPSGHPPLRAARLRARLFWLRQEPLRVGESFRLRLPVNEQRMPQLLEHAGSFNTAADL